MKLVIYTPNMSHNNFLKVTLIIQMLDKVFRGSWSSVTDMIFFLPFVFSYLAGHPSSFWTFLGSRLLGPGRVTFTTHVWDQRWVSGSSAKTWQHSVKYWACCSLFHTGPMVDSKVFICASAADLQKWMQHIDDRRYKSMAQPMSPTHCALSYLVRTNCCTLQLCMKNQSVVKL